jgi:DNA-binding beta-propeller fold protein YncE
MRAAAILFTVLISGLCFTSCKHEIPKPTATTNPNGSGYPEAIANIIVTKCATAGCHNVASYANSGGLLLDTWEHMFDGGSNGAVAIPYSPEYSSLLFFVNTDSSLGPVAQPTMPKDAAPLSADEYKTLRDWIVNGAPNKDGMVPFSSNASTRQKTYLTMQACDQIAVIDAEKQVVMRYISIGADADNPEVAHCVRFSHDGRYAFVCFSYGNVVQKIDASTDKVVATVQLDDIPGGAQWNVVQPNADGSRFVVSDMVGGRLLYYDFASGVKFSQPNLITAHGIAANDSFNSFYVTQQIGNNIYKVNMSIDNPFPDYETINIRASDSANPHEIIMTPDRTKLFITCQASDEVRVVSTETNALVTGQPSVIPVGRKPQEMAISTKMPYLFVSCIEQPLPEFSTPQVKFRGSIFVINYLTNTLVKEIRGRFASPHGVTVDDKNGLFYFASTNINPDGPAPHHVSSCAGNNGYYQVYDLLTLEPVNNKRFEVLPFPYSFDTRFK